MNADAVVGYLIFAVGCAGIVWWLCRPEPQPVEATLDEHVVDALLLIADGCGDFAAWETEVHS